MFLNSFSRSLYPESLEAVEIPDDGSIVLSAREEKLVMGSIILFPFMSTRRPWCSRKSAPRIGCETSATLKDQVIARRSPKSRLTSFFP